MWTEEATFESFELDILKSALRAAEHHATFGDTAKATDAAIAVVKAGLAAVNALDSEALESAAPSASQQS